MILWGAGTNGPVVPPGHYTARLTADGKSLTTPVIVTHNPRIPEVSDADLRAQYAFSKKVRDKANEANESVIGIRRVKAQLADRYKKSSDTTLKVTGETLKTNVSAVEENLYQVRNQSGSQLPDQGQQPVGQPDVDGRAWRWSADEQHAGDLRDPDDGAEGIYGSTRDGLQDGSRRGEQGARAAHRSRGRARR